MAKPAKTVFITEYRSLPPKLLVTSGLHLRSFDLRSGMVVGRATSSSRVDVDLEYNFVSRRHGIFTQENESWFYEDVGSTNGSYLNGGRIAPNERHLLENGDVLQIFNGLQGEEQTAVVMVLSPTIRLRFRIRSSNWTGRSQRSTSAGTAAGSRWETTPSPPITPLSLRRRAAGR